MSHEIKSVVVDVVARRIATEQKYIGEMLDGTRNNMHNAGLQGDSTIRADIHGLGS